MTETRPSKPLTRFLGFRSGLLVALCAPGLLVLAMMGATLATSRGAPVDVHFAAMVRADGASLSGRGGVKLILKDGYDMITQSCRGLCDDLSVDSRDSLYGGYDARLLDALGACVACTWTPPAPHGDMLVTSLIGGGLTKTYKITD